ncbi:MAG: DNA gyrase inhibitor YacG [Janthinobacterium lividum]
MLTVKCPTCGKPVVWTEASRFRPFCSDRCKQIDLGAWAAEKFAIRSDTQDGDSDDAEKLN